MNLLFPLSCSLRFLAGSHSLWWTKWPGAVRTAFSLGVRTALRPAHRPEQYVWKIPPGREMDTVLIPAPLWLLSAHPRAGASVDPSACRHLRCLQPLAIALRYYRQCLFWDRWNSHCVLFDFCVFPYHYNLSIFHVLWMSFKTVCFYDCESNTDLEPWRSSGRSISVHNPST